MNENKPKRNRLPNFTIEEETLLFELIAKHSNIIDIKSLDGFTCLKKRKVWNEIDDELTKKFGLRRGARNLIEKYKSFKKKLRRNQPPELHETRASQYKRKDEENLKKIRLQQEHGIEKILTGMGVSLDGSTNDDAYNETFQTTEVKHELYTEHDETAENVSLDDPTQNPLDYLETTILGDTLEGQENNTMYESESQENELEPQHYAVEQNSTEPRENDPLNNTVFSRGFSQKINVRSDCNTTLQNETKFHPLYYPENIIEENQSFAAERNKREAEKHKWEIEKLQWEIKEYKLRTIILKQKIEKSQHRRVDSVSPTSSIMFDTDDFFIDTITNNITQEDIKVEPDLQLDEGDLILPDALNVHKRLTDNDADASQHPSAKKRFRPTQSKHGDQTQWDVALQNDTPYVDNMAGSVDATIDYNNSDDDDYADVCQTLNTTKTAKTDDETDECKFLKLLTKYKLDNYTGKLKEMHIELDCLKHINECDIKDIFEKDIGARIRFRALVEDWRTSNMNLNARFGLKYGDKTKDDIVTKKDIAELKSFIKKTHNTFLQEQQKTRELIQHAAHEQTNHGNQENIIRNNVYKVTVLPIKRFDTVLDFKNFEETIANSEEAYKNLINELSNQPAKDSTSFIKSCWRRIMTDNVAQNFCWTGTPEKPAIRELHVTKALREAYLRKYPFASEDEFQRTIISFFQYAKPRVQKRESYEKVKTANM